MKISLVDKARFFASVAHYGQKYGDQPYIYHLDQVAAMLRRFGNRDEMLQACAYLHDTIEDTSITYRQLKETFSHRIADTVFDVTNELGRNRHERSFKTYPKIAKNKHAVAVKLADRIANVENNKEHDTQYIDMYRKEWALFESTIRNGQEEGLLKDMWEYLEKLMTCPA